MTTEIHTTYLNGGTVITDNHDGLPENSGHSGAAVPSVCLAWATKKRHIAINGEVLCDTPKKSTGYSTKNGCYNTIALHGLPTYEKNTDDVHGSHGDGFIEYKPLDKQRLAISTKTICKQCLKKYERELSRHGS